jgi:hypothetical protein
MVGWQSYAAQPLSKSLNRGAVKKYRGKGLKENDTGQVVFVYFLGAVVSLEGDVLSPFDVPSDFNS